MPSISLAFSQVIPQSSSRKNDPEEFIIADKTVTHKHYHEQ